MKRPLLAALLAPVLVFSLAESLYRTYWLLRRVCSESSDRGAYFALYAVGESTSVGQPYENGISLAQLVSRELGDRIGGMEIRTYILARGGESIYPQSVAFARTLRARDDSRPGAVLIYAGHNDATTLRGMTTLERFREDILARSQLLDDLFCFAERKFPRLRVRTLDTFEHHLRRVIEMSLHSGLLPILATATSNLSDMDPGLRTSPEVTPERVSAILKRGARLEAQRRYPEAIRYYSRQAAGDPPLRTYLGYRMARCYQAMGRFATAKRIYQEIADLCPDDNFGRATSRQNDYIRALARRYSIPLVDSVRIFEQHSPHGLIGDSLFSDGHHPNMAGYILLADAQAQKISEAFKTPVHRHFAGPAEVFRAFSYGKDAQAMALDSGGNWLLSSAARQAHPEHRLQMAKEHYLHALALTPDDFTAWMGLGLTDAAARRGLLPGGPVFSLMARQKMFFDPRRDISRQQLLEIAPQLRSCGVSPELIARILRVYRETHSGTP